MSRLIDAVDAHDAQLSKCVALCVDISQRLERLDQQPRILSSNDKEVIADLKHGLIVAFPAAQYLHALSWLQADFDWDVRMFVYMHTHPGTVFVDIGSNIGALAAVAARRVGADGAVITVDPIPECEPFVRKNISLNSVRINHTHRVCAVAGRKDKVPFQLHLEDNRTSTLYPYSATEFRAPVRTIEVDVVSIHDLLPPGPQSLVIKIDAEGAEFDILSTLFGKPGVLRGRQTTIAFEYGPGHFDRAGVAVEDLLQLLQRHRLEAFYISKETGGEGELFRSATVSVAGNLMISIPDGHF